MNNGLKRLGVDIGGVIIVQADTNDTSDTSFFGDNFLLTPPVPGVFDSLATLMGVFAGEVYVVSKCSPLTQARSLQWLEHHRFYERTGIDPGRVHFCLDREGKAVIAADLGLTHFVDNHPGVLELMETVPNRYLFQAKKKDLRRHPKHLHKFVAVQNWRATVQAILDT